MTMPRELVPVTKINAAKGSVLVNRTGPMMVAYLMTLMLAMPFNHAIYLACEQV
jgi:hypothetical protein